MTLDPRCTHLYVTRNAVLGYQEAKGGGFETIRRRLTTSILSTARPDPDYVDCLLVDASEINPADDGTILRVYTSKDGPLLVVTKVEVAESVP